MRFEEVLPAMRRGVKHSIECGDTVWYDSERKRWMAFNGEEVSEMTTLPLWVLSEEWSVVEEPSYKLLDREFVVEEALPLPCCRDAAGEPLALRMVFHDWLKLHDIARAAAACLSRSPVFSPADSCVRARLLTALRLVGMWPKESETLSRDHKGAR